MASYVDGILSEDEKVLYRGHVSVWTLVHLLFFGLLLLPAYDFSCIVSWPTSAIKLPTLQSQTSASL